MLAKIIPVKKLPYRLAYFDYLVPEELKNQIQIGQLVIIPFRQSNIYGIVFELEEKKFETNLKTIETIVHNEPILNQQNLEFLNHFSQMYGISNGHTAKLIMPPLQKRKLKKIEFKKNSLVKKNKPTKPEYYIYSDQKEFE